MVVSKKSYSDTTRRLLLLVKPHIKIFIVAMIALAAGSAVNLLFPKIIQWLVDSEHSQIVLNRPILIGGGLALLFGVQSICFYFRSLLFSIIGQHVVAKVRDDLYSAFLKKPVSFFDRERVGDLITRLSSDALMIQDAVSIRLSVFVRYSVQVVAGILLMFFISARLTFTIIIALPVLIAISRYLGKRLKVLSKLQSEALGRSTIVAEETLGGIRIVKAFNMATFETARYLNTITEVLNAGMERSKISAFFSSFVSWLMNCIIVGVLLLGVLLVGKGELSLGQLSAFVMYGTIVGVSFSLLVGSYVEFVQSLGAADRIFSFMEVDSARSEPAQSSHSSLDGEIQFDSIKFSYPTRPDVSVLKNVSFIIPLGKVTALVGPSGSGKSTIVSLLLGLYTPTSGKILIGGADLTSLNIESFRDYIAIVPQEPTLFAVTILENIRYGKPSATLLEVEDAADKARILEFIRSLPEKFETQVGERGVQLSAGQKQRIAIARAILRNPKLLILDEATSALDSENETMVQAALRDLMVGRTVLVIAHRLSTVKDADQVIVLDQGEIVQIGDHSSLLRTDGLYKDLVSKQELRAFD